MEVNNKFHCFILAYEFSYTKKLYATVYISYTTDIPVLRKGIFMASPESNHYTVEEIRYSPAEDTPQEAIPGMNIIEKIATSPETHPLKKVAKALTDAGGSLPLPEASERTGMSPKELAHLGNLLKGVFRVNTDYKGGLFYSPLFRPPGPVIQKRS